MYRNYLQFSCHLLKNFLPHNQLPVTLSYESFLQKRWAGHSKWANIRHTKAAKDQSKSSAFQKLTQRIALVVRQGGEDPAHNSKLKALIDEAKKINMPSATLQGAIKAGKTAVADKPYWLLFVSPSGLSVAFEVNAKGQQHAISRLSQHAKRMHLKHEKHTGDYYQERGLLICEPLPVDNVFDKAVEDAIDIGIEEVFENDDKTLLFECMPTMIDTAYRKLEEKGYNVNSATTELNFTKYIRVDKETNDSLNVIIDLIQKNFPHLIRVSTNIEDQ